MRAAPTLTYEFVGKSAVVVFISLLVYYPSAQTHANASQDVNSLYVILESVKQTGGDGGTQEVLIRNEREEDGYGDMMKTSDEPPEYSG